FPFGLRRQPIPGPVAKNVYLGCRDRAIAGPLDSLEPIAGPKDFPLRQLDAELDGVKIRDLLRGKSRRIEPSNHVLPATTGRKMTGVAAQDRMELRLRCLVGRQVERSANRYRMLRQFGGNWFVVVILRGR